MTNQARQPACSAAGEASGLSEWLGRSGSGLKADSFPISVGLASAGYGLSPSWRWTGSSDRAMCDPLTGSPCISFTSKSWRRAMNSSRVFVRVACV